MKVWIERNGALTQVETRSLEFESMMDEQAREAESEDDELQEEECDGQ